MEASREEIDLYIAKQTAKLPEVARMPEAQRIIRKLMVLKELKEDVESPIVQYIVETLEKNALECGKRALNGSKIVPEYTIDCKCGEKIDINKVYYQVYVKVHDMIVGIVDKWNKENLDIAKGSRR